jgi:phospholysine phosphohistidine inorganic pyrophosphate phosphatase
MSLAGVCGLLLDVDGTLIVHDRAIPGSADAITALRRAGLPFLLLTNTTRRARRATAVALRAAGFDIAPEAIVTPARLARRRILESGRPRTGLLVAEEAQADLEGVVVDERAPDWVVVGDLAEEFTFERMNGAFRWLRGGATLLALHRNAWWDRGDPEGPVLDAGAYVAALEHATRRPAEVVGKPSATFFGLALAELGVAAEATLVVGDDLEMDVAAGAAVGCRTALVRTGRDRDASTGKCAPDLVLDSIADLPRLFARGAA